MATPAQIKADAKTDIAQIKEQAAKDTAEVKKQEAAAVKSGQKPKPEAAADAKSKADSIADVAQKAIAARADQAKAVLKAEYKAMELKDSAGSGGPGKAAGPGDQSKADAMAAAKLAQDIKEVEEMALEAVETVAKIVKDVFETILSILGGSKGKGKGAGEKSGGNRPFDHRGNFKFRIELGSVSAGAFKAIDGLAVTTELIEYQGGGDMFARQIPGRPKVAPITLKKGWVVNAALWNWMRDTMEGKFSFQNVSVVLMDDDGQTDVARYELTQCWPSSWKGFQLDGMANEAMIEELELQVRHIQRVKV